MSNEKKLIIKMLQEEKISEDEAIMLLDSIKDTSKKRVDFSFFGNSSQEEAENNFEKNLIDKIVNAANKISKKSVEVFNSIDFDDLSIKFSNSHEQKTEAERIVAENIEDIESPSLEVQNRNGKIEIYTWENNEIEAKASVNYDDRYVSTSYDFLVLERDGDKLVIKPNYENASARQFDMNIKVALPKKLFENIKVESTNAKILVSGLEVNTLNLLSTNAKIEIKDTDAKLADVVSTNAKIILENVKGDDISISTTNGKIELDNIDSKKVDLVTTNGTLNISNIKESVESISAITNNGNINISLKDFYKPVRAKVKNHFKDIVSTKLAEKLFTNFITEGGEMIAYSEDFDENKNNLEIEAATYNGTISIL